MMNPKTHEIYSDKLCISVLNLKHIGMATEEDKRQGLDKRAAAFLAKTWEEFRMRFMRRWRRIIYGKHACAMRNKKRWRRDLSGSGMML